MSQDIFNEVNVEGDSTSVSQEDQPDNPISVQADLDPVPYDFRRPFRVSKERMRALEAMYERMAKSLEGWVIGRIRSQIEFKLVSMEQTTFGEFTRSLPTPCASFILNISDSGGQQVIVDVGQDLSFYLVDKFFGGKGTLIDTDRPLSRVERLAVRSSVDRIAELLAEVWSDHLKLHFEVTSFESFPDILLQNANYDDPVLLANIDVVAGEMTSRLTLSTPFAAVDKFFLNSGKRRSGETTGSEQERALNRVMTEQSLRVTKVSVVAQLPAFKAKMKLLASLKPGSTLMTGIPTDSFIQIKIGNQERFVATAGRIGRQMAVRLEGTTDEPGHAGVSGSNSDSHFSPSITISDDTMKRAETSGETMDLDGLASTTHATHINQDQ